MHSMTSIDDVCWPLPAAIRIPANEITSRRAHLREAMRRGGISAMVLTGRESIEYITGFRTLSWSFNTRPILALVTNDLVGLVCSQSERRAIEFDEHDFEVFAYGGYLADAITTLCGAIASAGLSGSTLAIDYGQDMQGRGSLELVAALTEIARPEQLISAAGTLWSVRCIKTPFEADLKRQAFAIANAAFDEVLQTAYIGMSERDFARALHISMMAKGADRSEAFTLVFGTSDFAYTRWPSDKRLSTGDYIWTDFRCSYGGYPADRNRIARAGAPSEAESALYRTVRAQTIALCRSIRPGQRTGDVYEQFEQLWREADIGSAYSAAGRIGHGGGLDGGEPPSLEKDGREVIRPGMILHVEPKVEQLGGVFQFEEIVFVTADGAEFLSALSPEEMPYVDVGA